MSEEIQIGLIIMLTIFNCVIWAFVGWQLKEFSILKEEGRRLKREISMGMLKSEIIDIVGKMLEAKKRKR